MLAPCWKNLSPRRRGEKVSPHDGRCWIALERHGIGTFSVFSRVFAANGFTAT
jgi:hypothetical protein